MTAKDALGVVLCAGGFWLIYYAIYGFMYAVADAAGLTPHAQYPQQAHVLFSFFYFIVGVLVIKNADKLVEFAYPKKPE